MTTLQEQSEFRDAGITSRLVLEKLQASLPSPKLVVSTHHATCVVASRWLR